MHTESLLRVSGALLILANAVHKVLYPEIALQYTWQVLVHLLPFDPALYVFAVQTVSATAAVLLLIDRYTVPAAAVLAGIVTFVTANLLLEGYVDLALREIALALLFYGVLLLRKERRTW